MPQALRKKKEKRTIGQRLRNPPRRGRPGFNWDVVFQEWLHSGKSRRAFLVERFGYFGGANITMTRNWLSKLVDHCKDTSFSDMGSVLTFVAQFGKAYKGAINVDKTFMGMIPLEPALKMAANAQGLNVDDEGVQIPKPGTVPNQPPQIDALTVPNAQNQYAIAPCQPGPGQPTTQAVLTQPGPTVQAADIDKQIQQVTEAAANIKQAKQQVVPDAPPAEVVPPGPVVLPAGTPKAQQDAWAMVQTWRNNQASTDWKTAEAVRNHIRMLTAENIRVIDDKDGKVRYASTLTPAQVRNLAEAATIVQRMQRLAIGLSTENIGIDMPGNVGDMPHVAKPQNDDPELTPLFIVEMNEQGKFVRQRPRRVN